MLDVYRNITIERLVRAKKVDDITGDYGYSNALFYAYIQNAMRHLKADGDINYDDFKKALSVFGIKLCNKYTAYGERSAVINYDNYQCEWYVYTYFAGRRQSNRFYSIGLDGIFINDKKDVPKRKRRPFNELSPELKEKIKKRNGWS